MTSDAITAAQHSFNNQRTIELFIGIESSKSLSSIIAALFFLVSPIYFRGEADESIGTISDTRINHQYPQTCFGSSEYELALILKELRWITDQVK